ncbi:hypothetical protein [Bartonella massiliensis]|nr:hypothetical protein [Bartonella massiliensis]
MKSGVKCIGALMGEWRRECGVEDEKAVVWMRGAVKGCMKIA